MLVAPRNRLRSAVLTALTGLAWPALAAAQQGEPQTERADPARSEADEKAQREKQLEQARKLLKAAQRAKAAANTKRVAEAMRRQRLRRMSMSIDSETPLENLIEALLYDDSTVRVAAARLAEIGIAARVAMPRMAELLDERSNRAVQLAVIAAMLQIDPLHPAACAAHHDRICNGTTAERRAAALALGALGAAAEPAVLAMISATREPKPALVRDAVTALGMLGKTAGPALRRLRQLAASEQKELAARAGVAVRQIERCLQTKE